MKTVKFKKGDKIIPIFKYAPTNERYIVESNEHFNMSNIK